MQNYIVRWRRRRDLAELKERQLKLNVFPETPPGFNTGFYPASALAKSNKWSFSYRPQKIEIDEYSYSALSSNAIYAGPANQFVVEWKKRRKLISPINISVYPETPITSDLGYYPASELKKAFRYKFEINLRKPVQEPYYEQAVQYEYTVGAIWDVDKTRRSDWRNIPKPPPVVVPTVTPPGYYSGHYPASALVKSFKIKFKYKHQPVILDVYPATAASTDAGEYPGSGLAKSFKYSVKRNLIKSSHDVYPTTPPGSSSEDYPAFQLRESTKYKIKRKFLYVSDYYFPDIGFSLPILYLDVDLYPAVDFEITLDE